MARWALRPLSRVCFRPIADISKRCQPLGVSYSGRQREVSGALKAIAWALIVTGTASYLSTAAFLIMFGPASWLGAASFLIAFGLLEAGAVWAAIRNSYGVSIALGGFVGFVLGAGALSLLFFDFGGF